MKMLNRKHLFKLALTFVVGWAAKNIIAHMMNNDDQTDERNAKDNSKKAEKKEKNEQNDASKDAGELIENTRNLVADFLYAASIRVAQK